MDISHTTIFGNMAVGASGDGGGIYFETSTSVLTMEHTIVAGNTAGATGPDIDQNTGSVSVTGFNFIGNNSAGTAGFPTGFPNASGDYVGSSGSPIDPMLGPLMNNGGFTDTHALLVGSPAIDAGDPAFTVPPDFDQRGAGFPRVNGVAVDIGAFEF